MHLEGRTSIVEDTLMPQVLEKFVEVAKPITYEPFMDCLASQVNFESILFNTISPWKT